MSNFKDQTGGNQYYSNLIKADDFKDWPDYKFWLHMIGALSPNIGAPIMPKGFLSRLKALKAKKGKVIAYKFKGKRFDCGSVEGYVEATNHFAKQHGII